MNPNQKCPHKTHPESGVTPCLQPHSPVKLTYINHRTAFGETGPSKDPAAPGVQDTSPNAARNHGQPQVTSNWQRRDGGLWGGIADRGWPWASRDGRASRVCTVPPNRIAPNRFPYF